MDIINRTRRGDMQRYNIFYTPFEVLIFKMSGKNNYVDGPEGQRFFSSINLKEYKPEASVFKPGPAGFEIQMPHEPHVYKTNADEERLEYEAIDKTTGDAYLLMKKPVYNYDFLEADSFDLSLIETSFRSGDIFDKQLSRKILTFKGYPALQVKEKLKSGDFIHALFVIRGPHYYVLAQRSKSAADKAFTFYKSFNFVPYTYTDSKQYIDTFLRVNMNTPVVPEIDAGLRTIIEQTIEDAANGNNSSGYITYWKKARNGLFRDEKSGDLVSLQMQEYPKYYYIKDSAKFWKTEIEEHLNKHDMLLRSKRMFTTDEGATTACHIMIGDTASSRLIEKLMVLKGKYLFTLSSMSDTLSKQNSFASVIFNSFKPAASVLPENMYQSKLPLFFDDLFSSDSATHKRAQQSISNVFFSADGSKMLYNAINRLSIKDKDYFDSKTRLIAELGYIKDTVSNDIPMYLKKIYEQSADTSMFQNEAIVALARLKTAGSFTVLKELMLQDPPIFEDNSDYSSFFNHFYDSLKLSAALFPQLLQLSTLNDYKENITDLLVTLVDSGYIKVKDYENYFSGIYIDGKVALRKLQAKEEKKLEQELKKEREEDDDPEREYKSGRSNDYGLNDYAVLLMPFYESNKNVQQFFTRLLGSKDDVVRMNTALLFLRNKKEVPDSILQNLAANDKFRGLLYLKLEEIKRLDKFPELYANQLALAKSYLLMQNEYDKMDSLVFLKKMETATKNKRGQVYFFKYRIKKTDDWKIAFTGLQPLNNKDLSSDDILTTLTDKKLQADQPMDEQLKKELKKVVFRFYSSGKNFFISDYNYNQFQFDSYDD